MVITHRPLPIAHHLLPIYHALSCSNANWQS